MTKSIQKQPNITHSQLSLQDSDFENGKIDKHIFHPFFAKKNKNGWRIGSPPSSFTPSILQGWPLCHLPHWSVAFDHIHDPGSMPGPNAFYKNVDVYGINLK